MRLATKRDMYAVHVALSATLAESRDAVSSHLDRALRRMVFALSAVMVASAAAVVLAAWAAS